MADAPKGYQRKDTYDVNSTHGDKKEKHGAQNDSVRAEIEKMLKRGGPITPADIIELSKKYKDDDTIVDEILRVYAKKQVERNARQRKLLKKSTESTRTGDRPLHEILNKMMKYKHENNWSDAEFDEFRRELSFLLHGNRNPEVETGYNNLSCSVQESIEPLVSVFLMKKV